MQDLFRKRVVEETSRYSSREGLSLEGMVSGERQGLLVYMVGCCSSGAIQWFKWLV